MFTMNKQTIPAVCILFDAFMMLEGFLNQTFWVELATEQEGLEQVEEESHWH